MISAELLKQLFDEMISAGFTEDQALKYIALLVSQFGKTGEKDGKRENKT